MLYNILMYTSLRPHLGQCWQNCCRGSEGLTVFKPARKKVVSHLSSKGKYACRPSKLSVPSPNVTSHKLWDENGTLGMCPLMLPGSCFSIFLSFNYDLCQLNDRSKLCECDREFALCLSKFPCPRGKAMCQMDRLRFLQNIIMESLGRHDRQVVVSP